MGFCGEMVVRRTPEKGTGGSGEGGATRGQGNFELAANFGYHSRGSADPRESLRKRRISKLPLTAHKVRCPSLPAPARPLLRLILAKTGDEFPRKIPVEERWIAGFTFS